MAQVSEKVCCMRMSLISISPSLSHVSPIFAVPVRRLSPEFDVHTFLPYLLVLKAQGAARSLATWPIPHTPQVMSPKSSTRLLLQTETRRLSTIRTTITSLTSRTSHARILNCSVFTQCKKPLFRTFLMVGFLSRERAKTAYIWKPLPDSERDRGMIRFCDQCCRVDVKKKSTEQCQV